MRAHLGAVALLPILWGIGGGLACIPDATLVSLGVGGGGVGGSGGGSVTSASTGAAGGPVACMDASQCPPGIDTTCRQRTCVGDICGFADAQINTLCTETAGQVCDGQGACVECNENAQCIEPPCVNHVCGLKLPNGDPCTMGSECQSGNCPLADGVCCDFACDTPCQSCVMAKNCGQDGVCGPIPAGTDPDNECPNGECFGGSCQSGKVVFVTSGINNGNMGGLAGADMLCTTHAVMGCLPTGTYMAWLSTSSASPSTRFTQSTVPYRRVDGTAIANNWNDLIDGVLSAPLNLDQRGSPAPLSQLSGGCQPTVVYSGTTPAGIANMAAANRCNDWTSTTDEGTWGRYDATSNLWSQYCTGTGGGSCAAGAAIYCFQQ